MALAPWSQRPPEGCRSPGLDEEKVARGDWEEQTSRLSGMETACLKGQSRGRREPGKGGEEGGAEADGQDFEAREGSSGFTLRMKPVVESLGREVTRRALCSKIPLWQPWGPGRWWLGHRPRAGRPGLLHGPAAPLCWAWKDVTGWAGAGTPGGAGRAVPGGRGVSTSRPGAQSRAPTAPTAHQSPHFPEGPAEARRPSQAVWPARG